MCGLANEPFAIAQLHKQVEKETEPAGLFADRDLPWLAATIVGQVGDYALIEVKNPINLKKPHSPTSTQRDDIRTLHTQR
ncbi:hypothetical protein PR048_016558 [Dryococelus australis]|uniref:Uncharacterized protein n=1 Tax=Dryococelus australis TaxID=614101 RepID=A0ABQ9HK25_9NEOP|nr:hypothetical protein PR048_016558 [Dryococelus australis]